MKKQLKKLGAFILATCTLCSSIPVLATGNHSDANTITVPVEEWSYQPEPIIQEKGISLASSGESETAASDIVKVHVKAVDKSAGSADISDEEKVDVPDAVVNLYVGTEYKGSYRTDENGIAEVSLKGLSSSERKKATISASKVVSQGKGTNNSNRDLLFNELPHDEEGDYYRYTLELHSETIDRYGNWNGKHISETSKTNNVDMVFVIDATGSMGDEINNVKDNIALFSKNLIDSGLNIRFSIIDYRDITCSEETNIHAISGSHWITDLDSVTNELSSITADGGGDGPESVLDPLGYMADDSLMKWRSDAHRFAFVLTDADYKTDNNYGYSSMEQVAAKLKELNIITSVITSSEYQSTYADLYGTTAGIYADINSTEFSSEMQKLSDSVIESVINDMTLTLLEPRLLVNLTACYFADDEISQSAEYKNGVKNTLKEYSMRMAEATDGHVMIDKIALFSTDNRLDFYSSSSSSNPAKKAAMADIRIETEEKDDGNLLFNVQIHSNAHVLGFFEQSSFNVSGDTLSSFTGLKDDEKTQILGKKQFARIQMSGTSGAGWNHSILDDAKSYSETLMHESGHYVLGLYDEYLNAEGNKWNPRPEGSSKFGLMDNQHDDIEMSRTDTDYAYVSGQLTEANKEWLTKQAYIHKASCEDSVASLLDSSLSGYNSSFSSRIRNRDMEWGPYFIRYTKASGSDRTVNYPYAKLDDDDFISVNSESPRALSRTAVSESVKSVNRMEDVSFTVKDNSVLVDIAAEEGSAVNIDVRRSGEDFTPVEIIDNKAEITLSKGELAELRLTKTQDDVTLYNTYYIDRSEDTDSGYMYTSAESATMAYVIAEGKSSYTFISDQTAYDNGEYHSLSEATHLMSEGSFNRGEIYSVASYNAEIDYTTLSWFKYSDGEWTKIETDYSNEENMNIGARADLDGDGMYVLMAKDMPEEPALAAKNLKYTQSNERDAIVTLTFDDENTNSKYYNVYYSENADFNKDSENVMLRSFDASSSDVTLNLYERGRKVYAAVEIVLEDGRRSELSDIILIAGEADSDGDGLPDWYCHENKLEAEEGKTVADSDADKDGVTNLEEYEIGSDPNDPDDPKHTSNIPVNSISVSDNEVNLSIGDNVEVSANIMPENATNKTIAWSVDNEDIVQIEANGNNCVIKGVSVGSTSVYAVSEDGGFSAEIIVTVSEMEETTEEETTVEETTVEETTVEETTVEETTVEEESSEEAETPSKPSEPSKKPFWQTWFEKWFGNKGEKPDETEPETPSVSETESEEESTEIESGSEESTEEETAESESESEMETEEEQSSESETSSQKPESTGNFLTNLLKWLFGRK